MQKKSPQNNSKKMNLKEIVSDKKVSKKWFFQKF